MKHSKKKWLWCITPPWKLTKYIISPENWWLDDSFPLKNGPFSGKRSSISAETSTQLCLATAFHHSLAMSPSSLGWCHLKRAVFAPVFVGVASNISKQNDTNNKEDVYCYIMLYYLNSLWTIKNAFAKGKMRISVFLPSKIKPRRGVKMRAMFGFTSKCQQTNVSQNQHRTENPDISPTAKHCVYIYICVYIIPKRTALTKASPKSHYWGATHFLAPLKGSARPRASAATTGGWVPLVWFCVCVCVCACVSAWHFWSLLKAVDNQCY